MAAGYAIAAAAHNHVITRFRRCYSRRICPHAHARETSHPPDVIPDLWYKNAIIYNLDVRSFMDADGDGLGDFRGLTGRLDYLAGLGVTAVWLMPFYPSPNRDDGYDVADYYGVDPRYGTAGDFVEFTRAAAQRGIRVLVDLVVNHTSIDHPWFQAARKDPSSKYRDWYIWSKTRPRDWNKGMVFPGVQKSTWTWDEAARAWYLHRFYNFQPDLNTANPEVQQEIRRIIGFWLAVGVNGFRMDAVPFIIGDKGPNLAHARAHYDMLRDLREFVSWRRGDSVMVAEANISPRVDLQYFGDVGERLPMMFNFHVNQHLFWALAVARAAPLARALEATRARPATAQWAHFLRNNDEVDLGRLPASARQKCFAEFGPDRDMQVYQRGIRRRLAPMLHGDRRRWELAYSLLFTLPGTPVIRYGDELGMGDDLSLPERNAIRTPMQWSNDRNGGFSRADKTFLPAIDDGAVRLSSASTRPTSAATRSRCSTGPSASSACARSARRSAGAISASCRWPRRRCWRCATSGATTRCGRSTTSPARRSRSRCTSPTTSPTCSRSTTAGPVAAGATPWRSSRTAIAGSASAATTTCRAGAITSAAAASPSADWPDHESCLACASDHRHARRIVLQLPPEVSMRYGSVLGALLLVGCSSGPVAELHRHLPFAERRSRRREDPVRGAQPAQPDRDPRRADPQHALAKCRTT